MNLSAVTQARDGCRDAEESRASWFIGARHAVSRLALLSFGLLLAACAAPRGTLVLDPEAAAVGTVYPILVATSRAPTEGPELFSRTRSDTVSFLRFDVSVPPDRQPGEIAYPETVPPDPRTDFVTVAAQRLDGERGFVAAVNAEVASRREHEAILFLHGYNMNFTEGLYREAQLKHDFANPNLAVHYSWPSAASARYYVYDLESALFARNGLEATLAALTRSRVDGITVVAHSMGGQVLMETLRQMAIRGDPRLFRKIDTILLISPDVNVDLFRTQVAEIAPYDIPIYIVFSERDRALRLSSRLRGERGRLGSVGDTDWEALDYNVRLVDLTDIEGGDPLGHFSAGTSPAVIAVIRGLNVTGVATFEEKGGGTGIFSEGISMIQEGAEVMLTPITGP